MPPFTHQVSLSPQHVPGSAQGARIRAMKKQPIKQNLLELSYKKQTDFTVLIFRGRGREEMGGGINVRVKHVCKRVASHTCPNWEQNPKPGHVL